VTLAPGENWLKDQVTQSQNLKMNGWVFMVNTAATGIE
jgi:hypothetical protein